MIKLEEPKIEVDIHYLNKLLKMPSLFPEGYAIAQEVSSNSKWTDITIQLTYKGKVLGQKIIRTGQAECRKDPELIKREYGYLFNEFFKEIFHRGVIKTQELTEEFEKQKRK